MLHQREFVLAVVGEDGNADAGGDVDELAVERKFLHQRGEDLLRDMADMLGIGDVFQQDHEFVAAQARHHVAVQGALQAARHFLQQAVAGVVAEGVVDVLEAVEVDEQYRQRLVVAAGLVDGVAQVAVEHRPVRQIGQRVVIGQVLDVVLHFLALGDVAHQRQQVLAAVDVDRPHADFDRKGRAILAAVAALARDRRAGGQLAGQFLELPAGQVEVDILRRHLQQLGAAVAQAFAAALVDVDEAALGVVHVKTVGRLLHQGAEVRLAFAQGLFDLLALEKLADVAADEVRALHGFALGLVRLQAEEFHDAENFAGGLQGEGQAAVQPGGGGFAGALEVFRARGIRKPVGARHAQGAAGEGAAGRQRNLLRRVMKEMLDVGTRQGPGGGALEHACLLVRHPQRAADPAEGRANGLDNLRDDFHRRIAFGQQARHRVLHGLPQFDELAAVDVHDGAEQAADLAAGILDRLADRPHPAHFAVGQAVAEFDFELAGVVQCRFHPVLDVEAVVAVHLARQLFVGRHRRRRRQAKDAVAFARPLALAQPAVEGPVAQAGDALDFLDAAA